MHIGMYILCNMYVRKLNYRRPNEAENDGQAHKGGRCLSVYSLDYRSRSRTKSAIIYYLAWRQPNFCSQNKICFLWGHVFMMNFNNGIKLSTLHNLLNKYLNVIISYCIIINPIADTQVAMACAYVTLRKQIHYVYFSTN